MRILIADGNRLRGEALLAGLKRHGLIGDWVPDSFAALATLRVKAFSALVLDHALPKPAGDLLARLRSIKSTLPILMVTEGDTKEIKRDRQASIPVECLARPFEIPAMVARLRAMVFGVGGVAPVVEYGSLRLDPISLSVRYEERGVEVSSREFALLYELIRHAGKVLTRAQLQSKLYEWEDEIGSNTIEVYIHNLRRKTAPELIRTKRGVGYTIPRDAVMPVAG